MTESDRKKPWVKITDDEGHDHLCPVDQVKDPEHPTKEEKDHCAKDGPHKGLGGGGP